MARTWPVTRRKKLALGALDAVAGPVSSLLSRGKASGGRVERILVVELWHMGDVVLATAAMQRLRETYPGARITLLAKEHARELLEASGLVDEIVTYDFPWTATTGKYRPHRYRGDEIAALVRALKAERFDLSVDCRMDLRSNILTRSIGATRRVGYDFGGGAFLLTDALPAPPADQHKVDDWLGLLKPLMTSRANHDDEPDPILFVTQAERDEARATLAAHDVSPDDIVVGIHAGGSHDAKRWPPGNFAEVGRALAQRHNARLLVFVDPEGAGGDMQAGENAIFVRTSIREMMALLTHCDMLLSNDSGPMHVAAALGVPVVAVFRTGNPRAYGPRGLNHVVVGRGAAWGSTTEVPLDDVLSAAESSLAVIRSNRQRGTGQKT